MLNSIFSASLPAAVFVIATLACLTCVSRPAEPQATSASSDIPAPAQGEWPKTHLQRGRYFSFAVPVGWQVHETTNGVDLVNPNGSEGVNFAGLEGTPGYSTPRHQLDKVVQALMARNLRITETRKRPFQHGFDTAEFLYSLTNAKGQPCEGWAWCAVNNTFGHNNCYIEIAVATTDQWRHDAQFLVATARLVSVINPQQAFQRDQLLRLHIPVGPGSAGGFNHPNTFTPYSNQAAMDRIAERNARARRDDYPLVDPSTGRTYHGSSSNYDYVRGGWVNPQDPTQLLDVVPPGK